jgi:hypothetical protein
MSTPTEDELAVAREEGGLSAARGDRANPFLALADAWAAGFAEADGHHLEGKDRGGHVAGPPHMCLGATQANPAVCTCCASCARACTPGVRDTLKGVGATLLHKIGLRRIAP